MLIRTTSEATRGIGELLVLTAMESLQQSGYKEISLGIVPMTTIGVCEFGEEPPQNFLKATNAFQNFMGLFYNASGMELFRKRFKVVRWDKIYLSVLTDKKLKKSETLQWINVILAITAAYKPSLQLKPSFILEKVLVPLKRFPTSFGFIFISILSYLLCAKVPGIGNFIHEQLIFLEDAPLWQWPLRTLASQFIYFDSTSFGVLAGALTVVLFYIEKEVFDKKWATYLIAFFIVNEILIKILLGLLTRNLSTFDLSTSLVHLFPTHGAEILLASLLGFATVFFGNIKDNVFALGILLMMILSIAAPLLGVPTLALLYGSVFFVEGYLVGKFYLNFQSQKDASITKNKDEDDVAEVIPANNQPKGRNRHKIIVVDNLIENEIPTLE
jgi:hypothetical protein